MRPAKGCGASSGRVWREDSGAAGPVGDVGRLVPWLTLGTWQFRDVYGYEGSSTMIPVSVCIGADVVRRIPISGEGWSVTTLALLGATGPEVGGKLEDGKSVRTSGLWRPDDALSGGILLPEALPSSTEPIGRLSGG